MEREAKGSNSNRHLLMAVAVGSMILLAGCGGIMDSGPSVSDTHVQTTENGPAILFNYSVSDYSTALMQGPNGRVINQGTLEPNKSTDGFYMGAPEPGTYKVVIQQGGETVTEKSITFDGPSPSVQNVRAKWSGNTLEGVSVTIKNSGDLPVRVSNATVSARDTTIRSGGLYQWIPANSSETVTISPSYQSISVKQPGEVRGGVAIQTSNGTISGEFQRVFEGANLTVTDTNTVWNGDTLKRATVTVRNTGDLSTSASAEIYRGDEELTSTWSKDLPPGASSKFELTGVSHVYQADSGGNVSLSLIVNSSSGFSTTELTHHVEPANLSVESVTPDWQNGRLQAVKFTVRNSGDVKAEFSTAISAGGNNVGELTYRIPGGTTKTFEYGNSLLTGYDALYTAQGGSVPVTVTVSGPNDTTSKTSTKEFGSVSGSISNVDTSLYGNYGSNSSDLSSVSFSVRNDGEVPLVYDSVEISIAGTSRTKSLSFTQSLDSGASTPESVYLMQAISVPSGEHELTVKLLNGGDVVVRKTVTVTAD